MDKNEILAAGRAEDGIGGFIDGKSCDAGSPTIHSFSPVRNARPPPPSSLLRPANCGREKIPKDRNSHSHCDDIDLLPAIGAGDMDSTGH